mgnify:CR=1 FL=1
MVACERIVSFAGLRRALPNLSIIIKTTATCQIPVSESNGTLTSKPFRLTHRYAAFLVAAGPYTSTRVEIVNTGNGNVIFSTPGGDPEKFKETNNSTETLAPVVADLERHQNKEVFIRVVDEQAGGHWGHLNFDDFKLYEERPVFANELKMSGKALGFCL